MSVRRNHATPPRRGKAQSPSRGRRQPGPSDVIGFWRGAGEEKWFRKDPAFDAAIRARFGAAHHAAARGELGDWETTPEGALALLLLLDQFPRNMYRSSAHAFATDGLARRIAATALERGLDQQCDERLRAFFYLPFEHSEDAADQKRSVELFQALGNEEYLRFAELHADIIERFGRFPHRNAMLGRASTDEERKFLEEGGFSG